LKEIFNMFLRINIFLLFLSVTIPLFSEAILTTGYRPQTLLDKMPLQHVRDTLTIKQNTKIFSKQIKPMSRLEQIRYDKAYNRKFFRPWSRKRMNLSWMKRHWQFFFAKQKIYNRYGNRISKKWFRHQRQNSNFKAYESLLKSAITIRHTDLKNYPTEQDFYYNPRRTGEGFPFDYNQNSSININTPLIKMGLCSLCLCLWLAKGE